ncbi:hypothetical protein CLU99_0626 [Flavobacterium sp. 2]|nr:hypothetical protein CLU99_0626 [Flavobacterium sp. 2]
MIMKKTTLLVIILFIFFGCKKEVEDAFTFDSLVLSSAGLDEDNSIKFTNSDTVFLQRRYPGPTENFYAVIANDQKIKFKKQLQRLNLKKYKSEYTQENLCDGGASLINISINGKTKSIFIYGHVAPEKLYTFIDSLGTFKKNLKFRTTKQVIDFGDLNAILPPPPPPLKTKTK